MVLYAVEVDACFSKNRKAGVILSNKVCVFIKIAQIYNLRNVLLLLLLLKQVDNAKLGEGDLHHISPKTPGPQQIIVIKTILVTSHEFYE